MSKEKEIWKPIDWLEGYEGLYEISNLGRVKALDKKVKRGNHLMNVREKIIRTYKNKYGYHTVRLKKNGKNKTFLLHRLLAIAFIPNPENKVTVNHKNGNKEDYRLENLEWMTLSENIKHTYDVLGRVPACDCRKGFDNPSSYAVVQLYIDGTYVNSFGSLREAERETGVFRSGIASCIKGESAHAGCYKWMYLKDYEQLKTL